MPARRQDKPAGRPSLIDWEQYRHACAAEDAPLTRRGTPFSADAADARQAMIAEQTVFGVVLASIVPPIRAATVPAYIDLGSASYLVQVLLAGLVGVAFGVTMFWGKLKARLSRWFSRGPRHQDGQDGP
jgi:hypothetical protein